MEDEAEGRFGQAPRRSDALVELVTPSFVLPCPLPPPLSISAHEMDEDRLRSLLFDLLAAALDEQVVSLAVVGGPSSEGTPSLSPLLAVAGPCIPDPLPSVALPPPSLSPHSLACRPRWPSLLPMWWHSSRLRLFRRVFRGRRVDPILFGRESPGSSSRLEIALKSLV